MVMQYNSVNGESITLHKELILNRIIPPGSNRTWLVLCSELVEALRYLHDDANIIHNDLKADNIVLSNSFSCGLVRAAVDIQIVVIDLGKATDKNSGRMYDLSYSERE